MTLYDLIRSEQRMWELAHPSVVIQRKDAETNGDLAEESEDERRRITKPKAEKPKRELHSGVYLGLEVEFDPYPHFCVYVHDGFFAIDYFVERVPLTGVGYDNSDGSLHPAPSFSSLLAQTTSHILSWLHHYSLASGHKLFACGFSLRAHPLSSHSNHLALSKPGRMSDLQVVDMRGGRNYPMRLPSLLWRELDVLPIVVQTQGETVEERAASACRKMLTFVTASAIGPIPRIQLTPTHSVQVDLNSRIHLVDLQDYEHLSSAETWSSLIRMANEVRAAKIRIAWFNSTAQGGGVALMRHALMRILKKLGVDAKWFVMKPDPKVYDITKRRFHNTLQGVSHERLTQQDKELYERWGRTNFEKYFRTELMETDVVVLDDPQVLCMLPHIKKLVPSAKIIFRCHIEIRTDLLLDPTAPISETWSYLWSFARHADLFVFHPVARFIPPEVPRERCVVMCPTTDPLDGLNKPLPAVEIDFYIHMLNRIAYDQCHRRLDRDRNYIVQVARFDPSKGIPELLESYRVLRERLYARNWPLAKTPQLLICGHGSVDDPDGMLIFHQVIEKMKSEPFKKISRDIVTARLPPSDQLLNAAVAGSLFACQLSQREGFEVKVTEALHHGKPVLVTAVGGIPHQVTNGRNGFIVPFRDVDMAAARMERLIVDERLRDAMGSQAQKCVNEEFWTPLVSINWLYMAQGLVEGTLLDKVKDTYRANERREKSWDAISVRSEVSDWGSVQDPERAQMEA
ncbi:hypothetical protein DFJ74DRAFT_305376 [Hyaloraphidium curvatum]|nr:hypothetical protein DFJ74DRAFT_305376 [Hyaloraphidium curvatum]